jgi:hypothetical protein
LFRGDDMQIDIPSSGRGLSAIVSSPAQHRATRHKREAQRARANALLLLAADPRVQYRGIDHTVAALAAGLAFERHDLTIIRLTTAQRAITLVIAPRRLWHRSSSRNQLLLLRQQARNVGVRTLLVPEAQLRRQPRLDNSVLVVACADIRVTLSQRFRVEIYVQACGGRATVGACAEMVAEHPDPVSVVLALVRAGRLQMRLDQTLTAESVVTSVPSGPTGGRN